MDNDNNRRAPKLLSCSSTLENVCDNSHGYIHWLAVIFKNSKTSEVLLEPLVNVQDKSPGH